MELTKTDLELVVTRLPKDVRELMVTHTGLMVGGGFIRSTIAGEQVSDIDLFGPAKSLLHLAALSLSTSRGGKLHSSNNAHTVLTQSRMPVQFITRWLFGSCEDLVKSFDFTVCQAAVAYVDCAWKSCCCDAFYTDLAARRLRMDRHVVAISYTEKMNQLKSIFDHCLSVADAKGHDYSGTEDAMSNFRDFGWQGIIVRIGDKYHRIKNFCKQAMLKVKDESVEDTLFDLINYAALAIIMYRIDRQSAQKEK